MGSRSQEKAPVRGRGRPKVSLLELVEEGRFSSTNQRHRRQLDEDDSLILRFWPEGLEASYFDLVHEFEDPMVELCRRQLRYRREHSWRLHIAQWFERGIRDAVG